MNGHIESVHEGKKSFKCNVCDTAFSEKSYLNGHIESIHDRKKPFQCNICDASFSQKGDMNEHIESVHENVMCMVLFFLKKLSKWTY